MGLLKATLSSANSVLKDQWLEFVTLNGDAKNILVTRGEVTRTGKNKGSENVISNGSRIAVPEGFAMAVVHQGKICEFSAEAGEFVYDSGTESSVFYGKLGESIKQSFSQWGERIKFGGEIPKDTRVYYINIREIMGNKFGTSQPVPFDDPKYQTIDIRYFGQFSVQVTDPIVLLRNVVGAGVKNTILIDEYMPQLKSEFVSTLTTAMSRLAYQNNISYNKLPTYQTELNGVMNECLKESWHQLRGISIISTSVENISVDEKTREMIREYDRQYFAESHGQGVMVSATAEAMKAAAANEGGNAGMLMGMNLGGMMAGAMQSGQQAGMFATSNNKQEPARAEADTVDSHVEAKTWTCECGQENTGKFCSECGKGKPEKVEWVCECGAHNTGKF